MKTGAHGWPLAPSKRFPGELTLACPKCGSTNVLMTGAHGPGGRLGDPGGHDILRCQACKHQSIRARKNPKKGKPYGFGALKCWCGKRYPCSKHGKYIRGGGGAMSRSNPHRRRSGGGGGGRSGGGTNWGMIALVAGGAFLLMRGGALGNVLGGGLSSGATVTPQQLIAAGYQDQGGGYYRNPQTGQTIYRNPTTGRVQPTSSTVPAGTSPWLAPFYQLGQAAIPAAGAGIATGIASLFKPSTWQGLFSTSTPNVNEAMGGTVPEAGSIFGDAGGGLPALPVADGGFWEGGAGDFSFGGGELPPLDEPAFDLWSGDSALSFDFAAPELPALDYGGVSLYSPDLPEYGWMTSLELAPVEPVYPDAGDWYAGDWF